MPDDIELHGDLSASMLSALRKEFPDLEITQRSSFGGEKIWKIAGDLVGSNVAALKRRLVELIDARRVETIIIKRDHVEFRNISCADLAAAKAATIEILDRLNGAK